MGNTVRTFIAIPLSPEIQKTITLIQDNLKSLDCNVKWVNPLNIHLTLKFLGEVKLTTLGKITKTLEECFSESRPICVELTCLDAFPNRKDPRILWVGLNDNDKNIAQLVSRLEDKCGKIGLKKEIKPFNPHITIGRTRSSKNFDTLLKALTNCEALDGPTQKADKVILYKSTPTSCGPIYEALKEFDLTSGFVT